MIWIFQGDSKRVIESSNGFLEGHTVLSDVSLGLFAFPFKTHGFIIVCAVLAGLTERELRQLVLRWLPRAVAIAAMKACDPIHAHLPF
ncbi:MAG: hypothetical protein ACREX3_03775 [Gammaproteobacteria bacterium]